MKKLIFRVRNQVCISNVEKGSRISQTWWLTPLVLATREAEAQKSLELGRQRLQWTKITPLHSSLGNRVRLYLKKKKSQEHKHV